MINNQPYKIVALLISLLFISACSSTESEQVKSITPKNAQALVSDQEAIIIDVREQEEWDAKHIPGAKLIPLGELENRIGELSEYKDKPVVMQCRSGKRSAAAANALVKAGFSDVYNLSGGIMAWEVDKLPVE